MSAIREIEVGGNPFRFRAGTSDELILSKAFETDPAKREYVFPTEFSDAKVIFDVGANIGVTALNMAAVYPEAKIFAFEPEPENFELLKFNVEHNSRIRVFPFGLFDRTMEAEIMLAEGEINYGGYSIFGERVTGPRQKKSIQLVSIGQFLRDQAIDRIDVLKIDCEGSENAIFSKMPVDVLSKIEWIEGELHGIDDFECLKRLDEFFVLEYKKPMFDSNYSFKALNKTLVDRALGKA